MSDAYMKKVRVIEFEDDSEEIKKRTEAMKRAKFLIYDFGALENVHLIDVLNFKNTSDKGLKFTIATFEIERRQAQADLRNGKVSGPAEWGSGAFLDLR